jgi:hypothetical protein
VSASETAEWWVEHRDWLQAAIGRATDAEAAEELREAAAVCESAIARLATE